LKNENSLFALFKVVHATTVYGRGGQVRKFSVLSFFRIAKK